MKYEFQTDSNLSILAKKIDAAALLLDVEPSDLTVTFYGCGMSRDALNDGCACPDWRFHDGVEVLRVGRKWAAVRTDQLPSRRVKIIPHGYFIISYRSVRS